MPLAKNPLGGDLLRCCRLQVPLVLAALARLVVHPPSEFLVCYRWAAICVVAVALAYPTSAAHARALYLIHIAIFLVLYARSMLG